MKFRGRQAPERTVLWQLDSLGFAFPCKTRHLAFTNLEQEFRTRFQLRRPQGNDGTARTAKVKHA